MNDVPDRDIDESEEDRRLTALLRATHAPANPAVWQRVRAELAAAGRPLRARGFDAVLAWFTRPAALAAATAALVVSLGAGYGLLPALTAATTGADGGAIAYDSATLMETLLDDTSTDTAETGGATEDGAIDAPTDSGGRS